MGLLDGGRSYSSSDLHARNSRAYRNHSPARSVRSTHSSTSKGAFVRPSASSRHQSSSHHSSSRGIFDGGGSRGIFNFGGGSGGGSSAYRRSPRQGYVSYLYNKLRRMLRELWYYARRHPMKAFFAIIVPLISAGGAIGGLMKQFGVRVPGGMSGGGSRSMGGGYYGSSGYDRRGGGGMGGMGGLGDMLGGGGGGGGLLSNAGNLMGIAKAFM